MKKVTSFILIVLMVTGCARQKTIDQANSGSLEARMGDAIHSQIIKTMKVYDEPGLNEYVQSVGNKLASHAHRKLVYRFIILEDDRIYSVYAPGGYVYITTGFFRFLENEVELAGILAEEIAMLQYKDPNNSRFKKPVELLLQTGTQVAPAFGSIGALSALGFLVIGHFAFSEKSMMKQVKDADKKALQYLVETGYDPQGLIDPLNRMNDPGSQFRAYLYDYLQTHPITPERLNDMERAFENLPLENREFDVYRENYLAKTEIVRSVQPRKIT